MNKADLLFGDHKDGGLVYAYQIVGIFDSTLSAPFLFELLALLFQLFCCFTLSYSILFIFISTCTNSPSRRMTILTLALEVSMAILYLLKF